MKQMRFVSGQRSLLAAHHFVNLSKNLRRRNLYSFPGGADASNVVTEKMIFLFYHKLETYDLLS
jgi:hypothetical protein